MDSPGRVVIEESKMGYELNKLQRDVIAVVTDQGLKKLDKKKKMRELLNPVPQPVFDQWLEIGRLFREYGTETQTEGVDTTKNTCSTSYGPREIQQLLFNIWSVNRDQGPDKKKKIWELLDTVPKPVFGQWFGIEKLVRECRDGDNENKQPNEIVDIQSKVDNQSKVSEPGEEHSPLIQSDSIESRIEELKRIQRRHKDLEIDYLLKRAKLKDDYLNGCKVVHEQGWNNFLLSKLKTIEVLANEITERDEDALKYLSDIKCTPISFEEFKVDFFFKANPYFKDSILSKTFRTDGKKNPKMEQAIGMEIEWHAGKSLANRQSFFNFFGVRHDGTVEAQIQMEHDYRIGSTIRENMVFSSFSSRMAHQDWRLIHPVSYRVKKYRVLKRDFLRERARLEAKYQNWFRDLYKERFEIVNGEVRELNTKGGLSEFWLKAMKNNEVLAEEITERDEGALKYLQDIEWRRLGSRARGGFELKFIFAHNPYFENPSLLKQFQQEQTSASEINWRHGQSLTHKLIEKPGKKGKPMSKTCESFFNFFTSRSVPDPTEDAYPYTPSEATVEGFKPQLRYDFYIGKIIRDKIIPHAIAWFTKEALQKSSEFHDLEDLYYDGYSENDMDECEGDEDDDE